MSNDFELAEQHRDRLIYEKDQLLAPMQEGMLAAPHPMVEGTTDGDYYRGAVSGPTEAQISWVKDHRPEDPTLSTAKAVKEEAL